MVDAHLQLRVVCLLVSLVGACFLDYPFTYSKVTFNFNIIGQNATNVE